MRLHLADVWPSLLLLALTSCGGQATAIASGDPVTEDHAGYRIEYSAGDHAIAGSLVPLIDRGRQTAEQFFGTSYTSTFVARVFRDRAALTARWRVAWNQPALETQCWMIAAGWATEFDILSPAVWNAQACGHDGTNTNHVANVVGHELVHVLQAQRNAGYTTLAAATPWIVEGLATFASGQWTAEYASSVRPIVGGGFTPETFTALWASQANYALAGSVFSYINQRFGAEMVRRLLTVRGEADLFTALSIDAATLLRDWRAWVVAST